MCLLGQYYKAQGLFDYEPKPTSTEGCFDDFNVSTVSPVLVTTNFTTLYGFGEPEQFKPFFLFRISYYYYAPLGAFVTILSAVLLSYGLGNDDPPVHRDLISPVVHFMLPDEKIQSEKDYYNLEKALHLVTVNNEKEKSDLNY